MKTVPASLVVLVIAVLCASTAADRTLVPNGTCVSTTDLVDTILPKLDILVGKLQDKSESVSADFVSMHLSPLAIVYIKVFVFLVVESRIKR